jgi:L-arabinose isomerase
MRHLEDFASIAKMECLCIDAETRIRDFKDRIRWNEVAYH